MVLNKDLKNQVKILNSKEDIELFEMIRSLLIMPNYPLESEVNSDYKKNLENENCPKCKKNNIIKYGRRNNRQRYKCKDCGKVFDERTDSVISNTKVSLDKWFMYIILLINKTSIRECARKLKISIKTSFFMRHRILDCLSIIFENKAVKDIGRVEEVYFKRSYKGNHSKRGVINVPVKSSESRIESLLENSNEDKDVCVKIYSDINGNIISATLDKEKFKFLQMKENFIKETKSNYNDYKIKNEVYLKKNVKGYYFRLQNWLSDFRGVSTKYLSNYLNLFCWIEDTYKENTIYKVNILLAEILQMKNYVTIESIINRHIEIA